MRQAEIAAGYAVLLTLITGLLAPCAAAQSKPEPQSSKSQIRVVTNEITVPVTVTDKSGEFVLDLEQKDFHVYDDGVPQTIDHWELGGDPLAVALVIETSTRLNAYIPTIHNRAAPAGPDGALTLRRNDSNDVAA